MKTNAERSYQYQIAQKRVKKIKGFYVHLVVYLFINIAILIMSTRGEGFEGLKDLSSYTTAFFWGLGLLAHGIDVFGSNIFFGKQWEERKIREIMEKEKQRTWE